MTDDRMALIELLQTTDDADLLKSVVELTLERLMAFEVEGLFGAAKHERSESRLNYRNGYRARALDTRLGTLELGIPGLPGNLLPAVPRAAQDVRANQPAQAPVQRQLDAIVRDAVPACWTRRIRSNSALPSGTRSTSARCSSIARLAPNSCSAAGLTNITLSFPSIAGTLPAIEFTIIRSRSRAGTTSAEALLDRLTHHVHILEMNGESYRLRQSKHRRRSPSSDAS
jgi:hypothetical protein